MLSVVDLVYPRQLCSNSLPPWVQNCTGLWFLSIPCLKQLKNNFGPIVPLFQFSDLEWKALLTHSFCQLPETSKRTTLELSNSYPILNCWVLESFSKVVSVSKIWFKNSLPCVNKVSATKRNYLSPVEGCKGGCLIFRGFPKRKMKNMVRFRQKFQDNDQLSY